MYYIKRTTEEDQYISDYDKSLGIFTMTNIPYSHKDENIAITIAEILNYLASLKKDEHRWEVYKLTEEKMTVNMYKPATSPKGS